jgi:TonB-dependent starch-binding outer membrane protein SusC
MKILYDKNSSQRTFNSYYAKRRIVTSLALALLAFSPMLKSSATEISIPSVTQNTDKTTVSGTIKSSDGEPLIGVTVLEEGTKNATVTDLDGKFTLNVDPGSTLSFSYVGFQTKKVSARSNLNITMSDDNKLLNEVVVVGYGTKKIEDITGAVANISADKTNIGGSATSVNQMLEGHIAGVQFKQNTAQPGGGGKTIIRGRNSLFLSTDPLYVVDGFIINSPSTPSNGSTFSSPDRDPLSSINPNDIESVAVLKDAAATAIYGSQGSNGVIIITTKKGKVGHLSVGYDMYAGWQSRAKKYNLMNAQEYMKYNNAFGLTHFSDEEIANAKTTDWQDEIGRTGSLQNHDLSFSGGNENLKFYFSLGYYDMDGIIKNTSMERYSGRSNIEYNTGKFTFLSNISASHIIDQTQSTDGIKRNSVLSAAMAFAPQVSAYDDEGNYNVDPSNDMIANPVSMLDIRDKIKTDRMTWNNSFSYEVIPGLKPELKLSYDVSNANRGFYCPSTTAYNGSFAHGGTGSQSSLRSVGLTLDALLHYDVTFNKLHNFTALLGYEYYQRNNNYFMAYNSGFNTDATQEFNLGGGNSPIESSNKTRRRDISAFGRLDYAYNGKYLATFTLRRDGSSVFGENNKFAWFPGLSVGWRMDKENFLSDKNAIDLLKLRLGYGLSGNSGINPYESLAKYQLSTEGVIGNNKVTDAILTEYKENPDLKWETTSQLNFGVDYGFFGRLTGSLDFFLKNTKDMLVQVSQDPMTGHSYQWQNAAKMRVWGIELSLNSTNIQSDKFRWDTNLNFSWTDNEITGYNMTNSSTISALNNIGVIKGERTNSYYTYVVDGIDPSTGAYKYEDLDGDGTITVKDKAILGSPDPRVIIGLGNTFRYGKWTLDVFFNSNFGNKLYDYTRMNYLLPNSSEVSNYLVGAENYWTPTNTATTIAANRANGNGNALYNSLWIEDAWFIRLQNVRLAYNLSNIPFIHKILTNASVYFQAQNLFCITPYKGLDPELTNNAYMATSENLPAFLPGSIDQNSYYPARTFTFGLSLHF